jgi:hypothetical protein
VGPEQRVFEAKVRAILKLELERLEVERFYFHSSLAIYRTHLHEIDFKLGQMRAEANSIGRGQALTKEMLKK